MAHPIYDLIQTNLYDGSPYSNLDSTEGLSAVEGWGAQSPVFQTLIEEYQPDVIIEVGSWKGASAIQMAQLQQEQNIDGVVVCIDTWLGSAVHRSTPEGRETLRLKNGFPQIFEVFLKNVAAAKLCDRIAPIPQPATSAFLWLQSMSVQASLIYVDADHEALNVYSDVSNYWQLVSPGGARFGDDFLANWPGVVEAVRLFAAKNDLKLETFEEKWLLRKPVV